MTQQRGTRRPRSSSTDIESDRPPQRRQRQSTATSSSDIPLQQRSSTSLKSIQSLPLGRGMPGDMGPPTTSYHPPITSSHAGPSHNGHSNGSASVEESGGFQSLLGSVQRVRGGQLLYEEDSNWGDEAHFETPITSDSESALPSISLRPGAKRMPINREEVVRLMLQGLRDAGYDQSADVLEAESGFALSSTAASDFQSAILGGRWSEAIGYLGQLGFDMPSSGQTVSIKVEPESRLINMHEGSPRAGTSITEGSSSNGVITLTPIEQARFLISQQKYLEQLELGQQKKALATLRSELTPIVKDREVLHSITGYMMCFDRDDLYDKAEWDGAAGQSRAKLLEQLQAYISPRVMVPQKRLATLLDQARRYQAQSCMYHQITDAAPSLYTDHNCRAGSFPTVTTHVLMDHTDEVWRIEWSPDGSMLASAGKDRQVVIWLLESAPDNDVQGKWSIRPMHHLRDHRDSVDVISWAPDGKTLVTGADKGLYVWDTETGQQKPTAMGESPHHDQIAAIQWLPDGTGFIVTSLDRKLVFYTASGGIIRQWSFGTTQITDFLITPDATRLIALTTSLERVPIGSKLKQSMSVRPPESGQPGASSNTRAPSRQSEDMAFGYGEMEHGIMVIRLADKEIVDWSNDLHCEITGVKLSWDGKRVLVSCNPDEIQMWQIEPSLKKLRSFRGHVQSRFLIRSCFGAIKDRFVLSGSEDSHVYVWQTNLTKPIEVLEGHEATVNSVAWNPVSSRKLFATCSDDRTIRIWQPVNSDNDPDELVEPKTESMGDGSAANELSRSDGTGRGI